jgi:CDP-glucose 4,6-dehydratase
VFVTGATGLVGGWLVPELLDAGAEVVALVRDDVPQSMFFREGFAERTVVVRGSLSDFSLIRRVLSDYDIDVVFHLAAQTLVGSARKDPLTTLETNVRGTWNVLEAGRQVGVGGIVVASSDKAYGSSEQLPYRETHALQGTYPYDCSKSCTDLIASMYAATYGLRVGIARCGNIFGGGDLNFSRVIPGVIRATLNGERFTIRSDGKFVRDYLYVRDAAAAYMWLAENIAQAPELSGEAFNFSIETRLTVLDIVHKTLELMNRADLEPVIQNVATSEIREQYMSCDKAYQLGWRPRHGLEGGLRETVDWYANFLQLATPLIRVDKAAKQ